MDDHNLTDAQIVRQQLRRIERDLTTVKSLLWALLGFGTAAALKYHGWF
jgi:hypothetical protein